MDGGVFRRDALDILRIEDVPIADELRVSPRKLLLTGILYLVEGSPPVVRVAAHEPNEAKMHTVSALIHGAGDEVLPCDEV